MRPVSSHVFPCLILVSSCQISNRIFFFSYVSEQTGVSFSSHPVARAILFPRLTFRHGVSSRSCLTLSGHTPGLLVSQPGMNWNALRFLSVGQEFVLPLRQYF